MSESTTRDRILDEAERLFAERGFDATSMRAITAAAGVNLAAVNYHFGSKLALLREAMRRRVTPVNEERLRRLDAAIAAAGGGTPTLEAIVDAFVRPPIEQFAGTDPAHFMGMLRLLYSEQTEEDICRDLFRPVIERFAILADAAPHLDEQEVAWRFRFMVGSMVQSLAPGLNRLSPTLDRDDTRRLADMLVRWAAAGFRAPATPSPAVDGASPRARAHRHQENLA